MRTSTALWRQQIQSAVRRVTEKPILYLVNTNYHGDHTFGNYAFPAETLIIAQRETAERMRAFEQEKQFLLGTVDNDPTVFCRRKAAPARGSV
jgi:cyclase